MSKVSNLGRLARRQNQTHPDHEWLAKKLGYRNWNAIPEEKRWSIMTEWHSGWEQQDRKMSNERSS